MRSALQKLTQNGIQVSKELWVRFGENNSPSDNRYTWVFPGGKVCGYYEGYISKASEEGDLLLVKLIDFEKDTRYICFVNRFVLKQLELVESEVLSEKGFKTGFKMCLLYHGKESRKNKTFHRIEVLYDPDDTDSRLVKQEDNDDIDL